MPKVFKFIFLLSMVGLVLPMLEGSNAYADPPPWAPAHGYRAKHKHGHDRHDEDDDEDRRPVVVVPAQPVQVVPVQPVQVAPYGIAQGTCNRKLIGQVLGGATGAVIGSQFGGGNGRTAAMIGGGILGVIVGGNIGQSMDRADQGCVSQVLEHAPAGQRVAWTDPDNGGRYQVVPERSYRNREGQSCRKYLTTALIDGYNQQVSGTACRQPDGTWRTVN